MTLTTEIQANIDNMVAQATGRGRRMSETGGKDVEDLEQLSIGELCDLIEEIIRELRRRGTSISPTIRRRASIGATAARVRRSRR